ncbi:DUF4123 domain-containing protein [Luteimonas sp. SJ-92]|uniref:DUF4123 domain-containing protein n=1 Tax=Luteimonas salinisoli TaxID=2752307 RepID=A0A853J784_9GAMM|nr:DUF4123 domain-containing protein [Luteimonas salinisoli]NZA24923.1 DUF4123 domain-containing protein [Luteimonas salinisoli]
MAWQRYALLDCGADPQLHPALFDHRMRSGLRARGLLERQPEAAHANKGPWLLEVPTQQANPELVRWLIHVGHQAPCLAWLAAEVPFDALFDHLEAQLDLALPDGGLAMMRFWDPRAFYRLQRILTPGQLLALLGPVLEWQIALAGRPMHVRREDLKRSRQEQDAHAGTHP